MAAALYHPQHGYYTSGRATIGRAGDFITSVSVGPLFGRLLARQLIEMWERLGNPERWTIVEQGAHRGELARDVLQALRELSPPRVLRNGVCDHRTCGSLERRTEDHARGAAGAVVCFAGGTPQLHRRALSNELLDAFPVHLCERAADGWVERYVTWDSASFVFTRGPLTDPRLEPHLAGFPATPGFVAEVNLAARDWLNGLVAKLTRGYALIIDYGYSREQLWERPAGTLSAYTAHQRQPDPLARPGEVDLTAHVDFSSLMEHAAQQGLRICGFTDQHRYLVKLSPLHYAEGSIGVEERQAFKTLTHPTFLGSSFKVLALEKSPENLPALTPFA